MTNDKIHYVSSQGLKDLQIELEEIKDIKIPAIAALIDEAKQQGDLSENAEYHQAKDEMAWAHSRVREIRYLLDHSELVESVKKNEGVIIVGSTIVIKNDSVTKTYTIVGHHEASPLQGKISNESPLGGSFLGHKIGDRVSVNTPAGQQTYEVLEIN